MIGAQTGSPTEARLLRHPVQLRLILDDLLERFIGQTTDGHLSAIHHQRWRLVDVQSLRELD